jgi:hypothetical protein
MEMLVRLVRQKSKGCALCRVGESGANRSGSSTSPSTTSPSTPAPSTTADCEETTEEYEVAIPGSDDNDDEAEAPYCDEVESADSNSLSRRGRGQHWQRSLDQEFAVLDKRYIPKAPAGVPGAQRRSRRHTAPAKEARAQVTATGL